MGNINPFPSHNIEKSKGKTLKFEQSLPQLANMAALSQYDWLLAIITIAFCFSAFGNGANDVANSYATSVAARIFRGADGRLGKEKEWERVCIFRLGRLRTGRSEYPRL